MRKHYRSFILSILWGVLALPGLCHAWGGEIRSNAPSQRARVPPAIPPLGLQDTRVPAGTVPTLGVAAGIQTIYALSAENRCVWGAGNSRWGQLSTLVTATVNSWRKIMCQVDQMGAGYEHLLTVSSGPYRSVSGEGGAASGEGYVRGLGRNDAGQLGIGNSFASRQTPTLARTENGLLRNIVMVAGGGYHSLALDSGGRIWVTGLNDRSQLGTTAGESCNFNGSTQPCQTRWKLTNLPGNGTKPYIWIAAGERFSLALDADGVLYAVGENTSGQTGRGTKSTAQTSWQPVLMYAPQTNRPRRILRMTAGRNFFLYLSNDFKVYGFGNNSFGQLGTVTDDGTDFLNANVAPITPSGFDQHVIGLGAGVCTSLLVTNTGRLYGAGCNGSGQIGRWDTVSGSSLIQTLDGVYATDSAGALGEFSEARRHRNLSMLVAGGSFFSTAVRQGSTWLTGAYASTGAGNRGVFCQSGPRPHWYFHQNGTDAAPSAAADCDG